MQLSRSSRLIPKGTYCRLCWLYQQCIKTDPVLRRTKQSTFLGWNVNRFYSCISFAWCFFFKGSSFATCFVIPKNLQFLPICCFPRNICVRCTANQQVCFKHSGAIRWWNCYFIFVFSKKWRNIRAIRSSLGAII